MIIKLIRHGESKANAGEIWHHDLADADIPLSKEGERQARIAGIQLGPDFVSKSLIYTSHYLRAKQTTACILEGSRACVQYEQRDRAAYYEDPRLREVEHGFEKTKNIIDIEEELRKKHGWFNYRFAGGESPADCYDRVSSFIDSLHRQMERKRMSRGIVVSHGITIRCFVMRWLHLTVDQFNSIANPKNCDIITIGHKYLIKNPDFTNGKWGVTGLRFRDALKLSESKPDTTKVPT